MPLLYEFLTANMRRESCRNIDSPEWDSAYVGFRKHFYHSAAQTTQDALLLKSAESQLGSSSSICGLSTLARKGPRCKDALSARTRIGQNVKFNIGPLRKVRFYLPLREPE